MEPPQTRYRMLWRSLLGSLHRTSATTQVGELAEAGGDIGDVGDVGGGVLAVGSIEPAKHIVDIADVRTGPTPVGCRLPAQESPRQLLGAAGQGAEQRGVLHTMLGGGMAGGRGGEARRGNGVRCWRAELVGAYLEGREHQGERDPAAVPAMADGQGGVCWGQRAFWGSVPMMV